MRAMLLAGAVLMIASATGTAADPPRNAALYYWQAFGTMPHFGGLGDHISTKQKRVQEEWETAPLDEVTEAALKDYSASFAYLHRGAACPDCVWASAYDTTRDGIGNLVPHLGKHWQLRSAVLLRARWRFAHGQPDKAVDDLVALVRFGRHLERGSTLIGVLNSAGIERSGGEPSQNAWAYRWYSVMSPCPKALCM